MHESDTIPLQNHYEKIGYTSRKYEISTPCAHLDMGVVGSVFPTK